MTACAWLTCATAQSYQVPVSEEHEKMQSQKAKANKQQNRLVFWLVLLGLLLFAFFYLF